jgi:hypothetical protein
MPLSVLVEEETHLQVEIERLTVVDGQAGTDSCTVDVGDSTVGCGTTRLLEEALAALVNRSVEPLPFSSPG